MASPLMQVLEQTYCDPKDFINPDCDELLLQIIQCLVEAMTVCRENGEFVYRYSACTTGTLEEIEKRLTNAIAYATQTWSPFRSVVADNSHEKYLNRRQVIAKQAFILLPLVDEEKRKKVSDDIAEVIVNSWDMACRVR